MIRLEIVGKMERFFRQFVARPTRLRNLEASKKRISCLMLETEFIQKYVENCFTGSEWIFKRMRIT